MVFTRVGLRGALVGLVLVHLSQTLPFSVYMLKNYFETIAVSLAGHFDPDRPFPG